ncbi:MAG: hypothetical protein ACI8X5_001281 [Planctomycetota bacterium]|jgi:hypothetical protein
METSTKNSSAWIERLLLVLIWLPYAALVRRFWFVSDDAYISFRFMRNWADGQGLRYNYFDGPPEEGYSNFLLVAIGTVMHRLGLSIELWIPMISFVCGSVLLGLLFYLVRKRYGASLTVACLGTLTLALAAPFAVWSSSGLETMAYTLLVFLTFERLILRENGAAGALAGLLAVLVALMRVEGVYWTVVLIPLTVYARHMRGQPFKRELLRYSVILLLGYGAWFFWKYQYYGHAFATTVHSKMGFSGDRLLRGMQYVGTQYLESLWMLVLVPGLLFSLRAKRRAYAMPVALMPIGFACLAVLVSGDFMAFGRFLVPGLPFIALLWAWMLQDLWEAGSRARVGAIACGVTCLALALLPGWNVFLFPTSVRDSMHFRRRTPSVRSEYEIWQVMRENAILWKIRGLVMDELLEPNASVVMSAIGAAGFASDLNILDRHGFVTPVVAMRELTAAEQAEPLKSPGHDHPVLASFFISEGMNPVTLNGRIVLAESRQGFVEVLKSFCKSSRRAFGPGVPYELDFHQIPFEHSSGMLMYIMMWKRVDNWRGVRIETEERVARVGEFETKGTISMVDLPTLRWGLAGLPEWIAPEVPLPELFGSTKGVH